MAFDLGSVKSIGVPAWLRATIGFIVVTSVVCDAALAWYALHRNHQEWFVPAVQLAGTLVPLFIAALLFAFSTTGPETLRRKTTHLLVDLIPSSIQYAATEVPQFDSVQKARQWMRFKSKTEVDVALHPGDFFCRYRILFPDVWSTENTGALRVAYLVMDLKVHGANMGLCVPRERFTAFCTQSQAAGRDHAKAFREAFPQTLRGAELAGCKINPSIVDLDLDGQHLNCIVVVRDLNDTFLSDPAEQLYLAQDLVAMLRSFWREHTDWFPQATSEIRPSIKQ